MTTTTNTIDRMKKDYLKAKTAYYNKKTPIMTDAEFDKLEDRIRKLEPKWAELTKTGVVITNKKVEVQLDKPMPSLNKAYPEDFPKFISRTGARSYIRMHKLDGTSLQLTAVDGVPTKLATRGDGLLGKDITFLLPALVINLPTFKGTRVYRLEAVISKKAYKKWASEFDDPRSMVNGMFNRRVPHPALNDVDLIVLGRYGTTLVQGLDDDLGSLKPVPYEVCGAKATTAESLTKYLELVKEKGHYEVDGLVVAPHDFVLDYQDNAKPKNIIAFKVNDSADTVDVTVDKIIWQITGRRRVIPKIFIKPTKIGGVMVKHAAAHNAKWMTDRKIGPGAVVSVVRSGGVIPKIVAVKKAGAFQPPTVSYTTEGVHFVLDDNSHTASNTRVEVLNICKFCKTLGIELIAGQTATDLHSAGLHTPEHYLEAYSKGRLFTYLSKAGFAGKQGEKILAEINKGLSKTLTMRKLMVAFQCFGVGIGDRKLEMIEKAGISMQKLTDCASRAEVSALLMPVHGFDAKTIAVVNDGMKEWKRLLSIATRCGITVDGSLPKSKKAANGKLTGQVFAWTGYRNKEEEAKIVAAGGAVGSLSSKTTTLFYKADGKFMEKVEKAKAKGVNCVLFSNFNGV